MAPHPKWGEGENRIGRQYGKRGKTCRNEIDRGRTGNATGIRREKIRIFLSKEKKIRR